VQIEELNELLRARADLCRPRARGGQPPADGGSLSGSHTFR
jgi:hypothetical protein